MLEGPNLNTPFESLYILVEVAWPLVIDIPCASVFPVCLSINAPAVATPVPPLISSLATGVVVPIPTLPLLVNLIFSVPSKKNPKSESSVPCLIPATWISASLFLKCNIAIVSAVLTVFSILIPWLPQAPPLPPENEVSVSANSTCTKWSGLFVPTPKLPDISTPLVRVCNFLWPPNISSTVLESLICIAVFPTESCIIKSLPPLK